MTVRVHVEPRVLHWAVERAADPDGIVTTFPKIDEWIAGDRQPTLRQLRQFAARTGVPFGYMLLETPPDLELPVTDFREGAGGRVGPPSPELLAVLHLSIRRQDWYRDYAIDNDLPEVAEVGSGHGQEPTQVAADMRGRLGFEVDSRRELECCAETSVASLRGLGRPHRCHVDG